MTHPKLGHFELLEQIGKGGMATVFLAYDPSLDRKVAIKLLDEDLARQDQQFVENFIREARMTASINHPNIVQIYFVGEEDGNYYIAMELLKGRSLHEIIKKEGAMDETRALWILFQVVDALQAAYEKEMIHGDIKPMNLFITDSGTTKLVDFGLAKMANIESTLESKHTVWGSAYYISPERIGRKAEDFRSDIYSLGATMFHLLVGHPPFVDESSEKLISKRLTEKAPDIRNLNPAISLKTSEIVGRMLNKNVFLRYLDYESLLADLRSVQLEEDRSETRNLLTSESKHPKDSAAQGTLLIQMRESLLKIKSKLSNTSAASKLLNPAEQEKAMAASQSLRLVEPEPVETPRFALIPEEHKQMTLVEQRKLEAATEPQDKEATSELSSLEPPEPELQTDRIKTDLLIEDTVELPEIKDVEKKKLWPFISRWIQ